MSEDQKKEHKNPFVMHRSSTSSQSIQLHQIGRPLIRLIEIQMIFKFFACIKCVDRCQKNEAARLLSVRPPPKWIHTLKAVIKRMRFALKGKEKIESDFFTVKYANYALSNWANPIQTKPSQFTMNGKNLDSIIVIVNILNLTRLLNGRKVRWFVCSC